MNIKCRSLTRFTANRDLSVHGFDLIFGYVQADTPGIRIIMEGFVHPE